MTNVRFQSIDDYNDVSMKNFYQIGRKQGRSHSELMEVIWKQGRDNSRTPMQWNASKHAGFSTANQTWLGVNPNYPAVNVEKQQQEQDSILQYYKAMIRVRALNQTLIYGSYDLILGDHRQIYAYTRSLEQECITILVNLSEKDAEFSWPATMQGKKELLLGNYKMKEYADERLFPYEARVYRLV